MPAPAPLPPPLPAEVPDEEPGARAIDLQQRPVAEILSEVLHSRPRAPEVPPPLPPPLPARSSGQGMWAGAFLLLLGLSLSLTIFWISGRWMWWLGAGTAPLSWPVAAGGAVLAGVGLTLAWGLCVTRRWALALTRAALAAVASVAPVWLIGVIPSSSLWMWLVPVALSLGALGLLGLLGRPAFRVVCDRWTPGACWTDRCSLPWLVLVWGAIAASAGCAASAELSFPIRDGWLTGDPATAVWLTGAAGAGLTAFLLMLRLEAGWWLALVGVIAGTVPPVFLDLELSREEERWGVFSSNGWFWVGLFLVAQAWLFVAAREKVPAKKG